MIKAPIRVGVFFNARRDQGGLYQYANSLVESLHEFGSDNYIIFNAALEPIDLDLIKDNWEVVELPYVGKVFRMVIEYVLFALSRIQIGLQIPVLPQYPAVKNSKCDVIIFVKPTIYIFLWPYPGIMPIHDLQHLFQPQFPEVGENHEIARREYIYQNATNKAAAILTDSEIGKEDVCNNYEISCEKVISLPYLASQQLPSEIDNELLNRIRQKYDLPSKFLFYPAAFWPHKNHKNLIKALAYLKKEGHIVSLVLAGSKKREYKNLVSLVGENGLDRQVWFLGYVPDEDLYPLYQLAEALIMPTFFGPTNIPVIEAWTMSCPVISSDIRGIREQVGEAGILVDPTNPESIARGIKDIYNNTELKAQLIIAGKKKLLEWTPKDFFNKLNQVIHDVVGDRT